MKKFSPVKQKTKKQDFYKKLKIILTILKEKISKNSRI